MEEFYDAVKGDYNGILALFHTEEKCLRFLKLFRQEEAWNNLKKAMKEDNCQKAFESAHGLKGLMNNMFFTYSAQLISELTNLLRENRMEEAQAYYNKEVYYNIEKLYSKLDELLGKVTI